MLYLVAAYLSVIIKRKDCGPITQKIFSQVKSIFSSILPVMSLCIACKRDLVTSDKPTQTVIHDARLNELSGIAASTLHSSILYVHNDSGDSSRFFAIDTGGRLLST